MACYGPGPRRVLAAGVLAASLLAVQGRAAEALTHGSSGQSCSEHAQAGMRDCLAQQLAASTALLRQAEENAGAAIARWDEDARFINAARSALVASNGAFNRYARAQCALAAALVGGGAGNARELRRLGCLNELNLVRARTLQAQSALPPR